MWPLDGNNRKRRAMTNDRVPRRRFTDDSGGACASGADAEDNPIAANARTMSSINCGSI